MIFAEELKKVGLEDSPEEINVIIFDDKDRKYPMPPNDEFDADALIEFVEEFKSGQLNRNCLCFRRNVPS